MWNCLLFKLFICTFSLTNQNKPHTIPNKVQNLGVPSTIIEDLSSTDKVFLNFLNIEDKEFPGMIIDHHSCGMEYRKISNKTNIHLFSLLHNIS